VQVSEIGGVNKKGKKKNAATGLDEETMQRLLEGDFDPDEFTKAMDSAYGGDYYDEEDEELVSGKKSLKDVVGDEVDYDYDLMGGDDEEVEGDEFDNDNDGDDESDDSGRQEELAEAQKTTNTLLDDLYEASEL